MKTDEQILQEVHDLLNQAPLTESIKGEVAKRKRPKAKSEDLVINVLTNQYGQHQQAIINANLYVADVYGEGQYEADNPRLDELAQLLEAQIAAPNKGLVRITIEGMHTLEQKETNEHFINARLLYTIRHL